MTNKDTLKESKDLTTIIEEWLPNEKIHQLPDDVGSPHETEHDRGHNECIREIKSKIPQLVEEIEKELDWKNWGLGNTPNDNEIIEGYESRLKSLTGKNI